MIPLPNRPKCLRKFIVTPALFLTPLRDNMTVVMPGIEDPYQFAEGRLVERTLNALEALDGSAGMKTDMLSVLSPQHPKLVLGMVGEIEEDVEPVVRTRVGGNAMMIRPDLPTDSYPRLRAHMQTHLAMSYGFRAAVDPPRGEDYGAESERLFGEAEKVFKALDTKLDQLTLALKRGNVAYFGAATSAHAHNDIHHPQVEKGALVARSHYEITVKTARDYHPLSESFALLGLLRCFALLDVAGRPQADVLERLNAMIEGDQIENALVLGGLAQWHQDIAVCQVGKFVPRTHPQTAQDIEKYLRRESEGRGNLVVPAAAIPPSVPNLEMFEAQLRRALFG